MIFGSPFATEVPPAFFGERTGSSSLESSASSAPLDSSVSSSSAASAAALRRVRGGGRSGLMTISGGAPLAAVPPVVPPVVMAVVLAPFTLLVEPSSRATARRARLSRSACDSAIGGSPVLSMGSQSDSVSSRCARIASSRAPGSMTGAAAERALRPRVHAGSVRFTPRLPHRGSKASAQRSCIHRAKRESRSTHSMNEN